MNFKGFKKLHSSIEAVVKDKIPIEEEILEDDEPEELPYLVDLKAFMSESINVQYQVYLSDLANFLIDNPQIKQKFVEFFKIEFLKQMESFEVFTKLEECYSDPDLKKIVPQLSFIFSSPNFVEIPVLRKHLRNLDDMKKRNQCIQEMRQLHNLENPRALKIEKKTTLGSIMDMNIIKTSLNKIPIVKNTKNIIGKVEGTANKISKFSGISKDNLKNLTDPSKVLESVQNIDMNSIKQGITDKVNLDNLKKSVTDNVNISKYQDQFNKLKENIGENAEILNKVKDTLSDPSSIKESIVPIRNLNIEAEKNAVSTEIDNTGSINDITTPLLDKDSQIEINKDPNGEANPDFYLTNEELDQDELKMFLVQVFNKLDDVGSLILKESIVNCFPEIPNNFENYWNEDGSITDVNLYFILIAYFTSIVNYFTGLKCKYYIDEADCFNVDFYLCERKLREVASQVNYKTQYRIISSLRNYNPNDEKGKQERLTNEEFIKLNTIPFDELDKENISHFPPFDTFNTSRKFRNFYKRFDNEKADKEHLCEKCLRMPKNTKDFYITSCGSSYFRHIDKQRIVLFTLESIVDVRKLVERLNKNEFEYKYLLMEVIYTHNYESYEEELSQKNIIKSYFTIFNSSSVVKMNNTLRKFLGEEFGFYYFWLSDLISMLIFPAIIGVIIVATLLTLRQYYGLEEFYQNRIDIYFMVPFSCMIIIWGNIYYQCWIAEEKFCKYNWGMTEYFADEQLNINIKSTKKDESLQYKKFLDLIFPYVDKGKMFFKKTVSWLLTTCLFLMCIGLNVFVFWVQYEQVNQQSINNQLGTEQQLHIESNSSIKTLFWYYIVPIIMYFVREFMTFSYYNISKFLTKWEGNLTYSDYRYSFILKASFFQFFNYYFNLYFIAFVKRYYGSCNYDNCKIELAQQLTVILITAIIDDVRSLLWIIYNSPAKVTDIFNMLKNQSRVEDNDGSNKNHFYTRTIYEEKNADKEYVQIIMTYGYIVQFGTASPLCFLFALVQTFIARITDSIKMTKYSHVNNIDGSKGLGSHLRIIYFLNIIGLITNVTINLFVDDRVLTIEVSKRWLTLFIVENFLLITLFFISYSSLPYWFKKYKNKTKTSYIKAFNARKEMISKKRNKNSI